MYQVILNLHSRKIHNTVYDCETIEEVLSTVARLLTVDLKKFPKDRYLWSYEIKTIRERR